MLSAMLLSDLRQIFSNGVLRGAEKAERLLCGFGRKSLLSGCMGCVDALRKTPTEVQGAHELVANLLQVRTVNEQAAVLLSDSVYNVWSPASLQQQPL